jgi:hypothetical protein
LHSYTLNVDGTTADGLDMRDASYDGWRDSNGWLTGGFGKLCDGRIGADNFERHPERWVGWRRDVVGMMITSL